MSNLYNDPTVCQFCGCKLDPDPERDLELCECCREELADVAPNFF